MKKMMNVSECKTLLEPFLKPICMVLSIVVIFGLARHFHGLDLFLNNHMLLRKGIKGPAIFLLVAIVMCTIGFPRQVVCLTAGVVYGFWLGIMYATVATVLGAFIAYYWAQWLGSEWGNRYIVNSRLRKIHYFIQNNPFHTVLVFRLMPIGSSVLLNMMAGIVGISVLPFFAATFLGSFPQTVVFVLLGGGIRIGHQGQILVSLLLLMVSVGIGIILMKRSVVSKE